MRSEFANTSLLTQVSDMTQLSSPTDSTNRPRTSNQRRGREAAAIWLSGICIFVFLAVLVGLFIYTGGYPSTFGMALGYVAIALITGGFFWLFRGSTGEVELKELGIKLGGAAAIGAAFMLLASKLTLKPDLDQVIMVSCDTANAVRLSPKTPIDCHVVPLLGQGGGKGSAEFLVRLSKDGPGEFSVNYFGSDGRLFEQHVQVAPTGAPPTLGEAKPCDSK